MRAGVEPRRAPCELRHMELSAFKIRSVDVRDLEFAASRRAKSAGDLQHSIVVEVQAGHRVTGFRHRWLLLDRDRVASLIQLDNPVALRIPYRVREDRCANGA